MDIRTFLSYKDAEKERWIAAKKQERQELSNLVQSKLPQVAQPSEYPAFLRFQSKFLNFSARNAILIYAQRPHAEQAASLKVWNRRGRSVLSGESGIRILTPGDSGNHFVIQYVFDISQTKGMIQKKPPQLANGTPEMEKALQALIRTSPVTIEPDDMLDCLAKYHYEQRKIFLRPDLEDTDMFYALIKEIADASFHQDANGKDMQTSSIAYLTCCYFGVEAKEPDSTSLACDTPDELLEKLEFNRNFARAMAGKIERGAQLKQKDFRQTR